MSEGTAAAVGGGATEANTKRIRLEVSSPGAPNLSGITEAITQLRSLNLALMASERLSGRLRSNLEGVNLGSINTGAGSAAKAIDGVANSAKAATNAVSTLTKQAANFANEQALRDNTPSSTRSTSSSGAGQKQVRSRNDKGELTNIYVEDDISAAKKAKQIADYKAVNRSLIEEEARFKDAWNKIQKMPTAASGNYTGMYATHALRIKANEDYKKRLQDIQWKAASADQVLEIQKKINSANRVIEANETRRQAIAPEQKDYLRQQAEDKANKSFLERKKKFQQDVKNIEARTRGELQRESLVEAARTVYGRDLNSMLPGAHPELRSNIKAEYRANKGSIIKSNRAAEESTYDAANKLAKQEQRQQAKRVKDTQAYAAQRQRVDQILAFRAERAKLDAEAKAVKTIEGQRAAMWKRHELDKRRLANQTALLVEQREQALLAERTKREAAYDAQNRTARVKEAKGLVRDDAKRESNRGGMTKIQMDDRDAAILEEHKKNEALKQQLDERNNKAFLDRKSKFNQSVKDIEAKDAGSQRQQRIDSARRQYAWDLFTMRNGATPELRENIKEELSKNRIEAAAYNRVKAEKAVDREVLASKREYQESLASLEAKYGRTSSTSQNTGKNEENIAARQRYIDRLNAAKAMDGANARQVAHIEARAHQANLGIISRQGGELPWYRKLMPSGGRFLERGLKGFTPEGFLKNSLTAGGWMAAVTGVMKVTETVEHSIKRVMELQLQTAVLRQTFRGVGGTAHELADDVLKLAAAEGRGTEEALKAVTHWSRLGLSRKQAGEATRVSLIAANVGEMPAHEATEKLASVMATYNLNAYELNGTLGMLSRTSQTFRVTTGELLDGLSRVSNIAKESGMSLAQLQGIMGAMVQKTGLSGERVANFFQIALNRINNPDVQARFERRYKSQLTGNVEDFDKIQSIYEKGSAEERKAMSINIGTPRQSNLFSALMDKDVYSQIYKQAADSLRNLNAAEEENAKVTNTAHSAVARLASTWDRMVNSPGFDKVLSGGLNNLAGTIAGITGDPGKASKEHLYFHPEQATGMGSAIGIAKTVSLGIGPLLNEWLMKQVGMDVDKEREKVEQLQGFFRKPQAGDSYGIQMRRIIGDRAESEALGNEAKLAKLNKDPNKQKEKERERDKYLGMARTGASNFSAQLEREKAYLEKQPNTTDAEENQARKERILELEWQIREVKGQSLVIDLKQNEIIDRTEMKMEQMTRVMTAQKMLGEDIASAMKGIGLPKWVEDAAANAGQLAAVTAMLAKADEYARSPDKKKSSLWMDTGDALRKEQLQLQMKQQYWNTQTSMDFLKQQSMMGTTSKMAAFEIEGQGAGYTEGEKLMDKRKWLQEQIASGGRVENMNKDQLVRSAALIASLSQTQLGIQERILLIDKERRQVAIDTQREFQKSLITAGPGEILRKLATANLMKSGKTNAGSFFGMSPDMRSDAYTLMGGEGMARLNWEKKSLAGQKMPLGKLQEAGWQAELGAEKIGTALQTIDKLDIKAADITISNANIIAGREQPTPKKLASGGISETSGATYFPKFNAIAGEAGKEALAVLARPSRARLGDTDAVTGDMGGRRMALVSADKLGAKKLAGGGFLPPVQGVIKYSVRAMDSAGNESKFFVDAASQSDVISRIRQMGLFPTQIVVVQTPGSNAGAPRIRVNLPPPTPTAPPLITPTAPVAAAGASRWGKVKGGVKSVAKGLVAGWLADKALGLAGWKGGDPTKVGDSYLGDVGKTVRDYAVSSAAGGTAGPWGLAASTGLTTVGKLWDVAKTGGEALGYGIKNMFQAPKGLAEKQINLAQAEKRAKGRAASRSLIASQNPKAPLSSKSFTASPPTDQEPPGAVDNAPIAGESGKAPPVNWASLKESDPKAYAQEVERRGGISVDSRKAGGYDEPAPVPNTGLGYNRPNINWAKLKKEDPKLYAETVEYRGGIKASDRASYDAPGYSPGGQSGNTSAPKIDVARPYRNIMQQAPKRSDMDLPTDKTGGMRFGADPHSYPDRGSSRVSVAGDAAASSLGSAGRAAASFASAVEAATQRISAMARAAQAANTAPVATRVSQA